MIGFLRALAVLAILAGGTLARNASADSTALSPAPSACIASLLRNEDEQAQLHRALAYRLPPEKRAQIAVRAGVTGLSECASSGATHVLVLAHGGSNQLGDARITLPIRGVDIPLPWSVLDEQLREAASARQIQIAVCDATQIRAQYEARGNLDPRVRWIEAESVGAELTLVEAIDRFARAWAEAI